MSAMRFIIAFGITAGLLTACREKGNKAETRQIRTDITVYENPKNLSDMIKLPAPTTEVRWALVPVVPPSRRDFGPTDKSLCVVAVVDSAHWPAWQRSLTPQPSPGDYSLMEEIADKLLPQEWLASTGIDSLRHGRILTGTFYKPDSLATSWYRSVIAIRHGKYLFMEFFSG